MILFSCTVADSCDLMDPCDWRRCFELCVNKNYTGKFDAYGVPELLPQQPGCCCRVTGAGGA
ncbi:hypothetical protein ACP4OV_002293 [Aristida adscensionis]